MDLQETFKQSMRRLASTVSVVTCLSEGKRHGIAATAVTSLCADPPSVLLCINQSASIAEPLIKEGTFCVNLLSRHQTEVSTAFGGKLKGQERFNLGQWAENPDGIPYLADAQANLFCTLDGLMTYGTHKIIIGRVVNGTFAEEVCPLIYQDGGYASTERLNLM